MAGVADDSSHSRDLIESAPETALAALRYGAGRDARSSTVRTGRSCAPASSSGTCSHVELEPLELGGQRYVPVPESPEAALTLTRTSSGLVLELEFDVGVRRRLHALPRRTRASTSDVAGARVPGDEPSAESDELDTPYLDDDRLDLVGVGARRGRARAPGQDPLPRRLRRALPGCGADLNREPHARTEPRARSSCRRSGSLATHLGRRRARRPSERWAGVGVTPRAADAPGRTAARPSRPQARARRRVERGQARAMPPAILAAAMAVPKRKTSKSRRDKRRATHKAVGSRRSSSARSAISRSGRTTSARRAAPTGAARSSRSRLPRRRLREPRRR